MNKDLILARFRANQGLSFHDLAKIFNASVRDIMKWENGGAPAEVDQLAFALNMLMERWKAERGTWNDSDYQLLLNNAEKLKAENDKLKLIIHELTNSDVIDMEEPAAITSPGTRLLN